VDTTVTLLPSPTGTYAMLLAGRGPMGFVARRRDCEDTPDRIL
jgi:hypothetical protein